LEDISENYGDPQRWEWRKNSPEAVNGDEDGKIF
jgi:hypothetical protein